MLKTNSRVRAVVFLSLFLALTTLGTGYASPKNDVNDIKERATIKMEWLGIASVVMKKISDRERYSSFLEKNATLAKPYENGLLFLEKAKTGDWIAIVPLLERDKNVSQHWKNIYDANTAAHFLPGLRAIVLKEYVPLSSVGKTLVFLHAGYNAHAFVKNPYKGKQSDKEYYYEEVGAYAFQNKVMSLLGGKKYQRILDKEIARITAQAKKDGGKIGDKIADRGKYNEELANALGQPVSVFEKDLFQTCAWIHAVFVFLDNNFKGDVLNQKALFLRNLYKKVGLP